MWQFEVNFFIICTENIAVIEQHSIILWQKSFFVEHLNVFNFRLIVIVISVHIYLPSCLLLKLILHFGVAEQINLKLTLLNNSLLNYLQFKYVW